MDHLTDLTEADRQFLTKWVDEEEDLQREMELYQMNETLPIASIEEYFHRTEQNLPVDNPQPASSYLSNPVYSLATSVAPIAVAPSIYPTQQSSFSVTTAVYPSNSQPIICQSSVPVARPQVQQPIEGMSRQPSMHPKIVQSTKPIPRFNSNINNIHEYIQSHPFHSPPTVQGPFCRQPSQGNYHPVATTVPCFPISPIPASFPFSSFPPATASAPANVVFTKTSGIQPYLRPDLIPSKKQTDLFDYHLENYSQGSNSSSPLSQMSAPAVMCSSDFQMDTAPPVLAPFTSMPSSLDIQPSPRLMDTFDSFSSNVIIEEIKSSSQSSFVYFLPPPPTELLQPQTPLSEPSKSVSCTASPASQKDTPKPVFAIKSYPTLATKHSSAASAQARQPISPPSTGLKVPTENWGDGNDSDLTVIDEENDSHASSRVTMSESSLLNETSPLRRDHNYSPSLPEEDGNSNSVDSITLQNRNESTSGKLAIEESAISTANPFTILSTDSPNFLPVLPEPNVIPQVEVAKSVVAKRKKSKVKVAIATSTPVAASIASRRSSRPKVSPRRIVEDMVVSPGPLSTARPRVRVSATSQKKKKKKPTTIVLTTETNLSLLPISTNSAVTILAAPDPLTEMADEKKRKEEKLARNREARQLKMAQETPDERQIRLQKRRDAATRKRQLLTPEQLQEHVKKKKEQRKRYAEKKRRGEL